MGDLESIVKKGVFLSGLASGMSCNHNGQDTNTPQDTGVIDTGEPYECQPAQITSELTSTAWVNQEFSYTITAERDSHPSCDVENYYSICDFLNPPVEISDDSGVNGCTMIWTPTQSDYQQTFSFNLKAKDWFGIDEDVLDVYVDRVDNAPEITTTELPDAIRNALYSATITATDVDGDLLEYSLFSSPSWLMIDLTSGLLSGTPLAYATESVTVNVSDGELSTSQEYSLVVAPIGTLDMEVIDGDNGAGVENSCNVTITLTNTTSGYSSTATPVDGIATFNLDETGLYDLLVLSTNTDSNCYGGVSQSEWVEIISGLNTAFVTLIPESYQDEVVEVVGEQLSMDTISFCGFTGYIDSVTDLVKRMGGGSCYSTSGQEMTGWETSIRDGSTYLDVDTIDFTYNELQYNDALELAITYWDGHLAPDIEQVTTGGRIRITRTSNAQAFPDYEESSTGVFTIVNCDLRYTTVADNDIYSAAITFAHEMGHCLSMPHTNVPEFIMESSPSVDEPHELELLVTRIINNIGNENPRMYPINLLNGYSE